MGKRIMKYDKDYWKSILESRKDDLLEELIQLDTMVESLNKLGQKNGKRRN